MHLPKCPVDTWLFVIPRSHMAQLQRIDLRLVCKRVGVGRRMREAEQNHQMAVCIVHSRKSGTSVLSPQPVGDAGPHNSRDAFANQQNP